MGEVNEPGLSVAVSGLCVRANATTILDGVDLGVSHGEHVAILGHNGAGKTSLLRCVMGMFRPAEGTVHVLGGPVRRRPLDRLPRIGALLGTPSFYENLTIREHFRLAAALRRRDGQSRREACEQALTEFGLAGHERKHLSVCSSGMRKRVALACAFMADPDLLVLDDPTAELDAEGVTYLRDALRAARERRTTAVMLATHSLSLAREVGERVLVVDHGKPLFLGDWDTFDTHVGGLYEIGLDDKAPLDPSALPSGRDVLSVADKGNGTHLVNVGAGKVGDVVHDLVHAGRRVESVVPVPFGADEFRERMASIHERDEQTRPEPAPAVSMSASPPRRLPFVRRMRACLAWETKVLYRSMSLWVIPVVLLVSSGIGISAAIPVQNRILGQEVTVPYLMTSVLALLLLLGAFTVAIASAVAVCNDYAQSRFRFLFLLPLGNGDVFLAKLAVWNAILSLYVLVLACVLAVGTSLLAAWFKEYEWTSGGLGISADALAREAIRVLPGTLVGYLGIGVVSTILGVIFRRAQVVLSIVVLVLAISFVALPGFQVNLLPFTQLIIDANASLLSLGNGILPFDEPILSPAVMVSLGLIVVGYVVGAAAFARVRW